MNTRKSIPLWLAVVAIVGLVPAAVLAQVLPTCSSGPTEPLRWQVPRVEHHNVAGAYYGDNYCETTILVTNLAVRTALVQVEFRGAPTGDKCIQDEIAPGESLAFATAPMTPIQNSFFPGNWDSTGSIVGQAGVYSNRRNVHVAVHLVCRDAPISSPGKVLAMTSLPAIHLR